ncbi:MAG: ASCH domain-containing protein [Actinobacteria bacterium]|nr:ASCH domain-containing protein [Actinomycetota bacterium]
MRASATWPSALVEFSPNALYSWRAVATFALNFYSPMVVDQLRSQRKTATIRLGDKSAKYKKGMIVTVLVGVRYGQREKIFDAVIDRVEVKQLRDLSPREIEHDNPEIKRTDEMARFLGQLYNREVAEDETVTVIRFSQIIGSMF